MICSLFSRLHAVNICISKCIPTEKHKRVCIAQSSSSESWAALRHAAFGENCSTSHHRSKQLLWSVQTEMLPIDSPVFTILQSNLTTPCSITLFHISAIPPQFLPHPILQSLLPSVSLHCLKDCPWLSTGEKMNFIKFVCFAKIYIYFCSKSLSLHLLFTPSHYPLRFHTTSPLSP